MSRDGVELVERCNFICVEAARPADGRALSEHLGAHCVTTRPDSAFAR